jgi:tetratricopeptide (TPR) repeat protein
MDADLETRDALEAQRVFLLRSLDDLDAEREAGNIDDATYGRLHGDYTARAAAVLRALDGEPAEPTVAGPPPVSTSRRALVVGGIVAFAIAAAVVLALTIAPRLPGQTVTGGATPDPKATTAALKAAVRDHPNDYSARIEYARALIATDRVGALRQYDAAAKLRPKEPEPPTYIGWILGLASSQVQDTATHTQLLDRSLQAFALARRLDPRYADAYVFEGLVRARFANDPAGAVPLLQQYLRLAPDGAQVAAVRTALADAQKQAKSASTTTTS